MLLPFVILTLLGSPVVDGADPIEPTVQPEGPAPTPTEPLPAAEAKKQRQAIGVFIVAGALCIGTGVAPLVLGSLWYTSGVKNQQQGSDSEPGIPYGPVVIGGGAVVVSVGIALIGLGLHRVHLYGTKRPRSVGLRLAPTLVWTRDGARIGIVGRF